MMSGENHTINPPTDVELRKRLEIKLEEYRERQKGKGKEWQYTHPDLALTLYHGYADATYKAEVLDALLKSKGPLDTHVLSQELARKHGDAFDVDLFCVACGVIASYCGDDPEPVHGGTGLPVLTPKE